MKLRRFAFLANMTVAVACISCANSEIAPRFLTIEQSTTVLSGWIYFNGNEAALFPTRNVDSYDGFSVPENERCVSLAVDDGVILRDLDGKIGTHIYVQGFARRWEEFSLGESEFERTFSKRYYRGRLVENYCNREFVFVVSKISGNG